MIRWAGLAAVCVLVAGRAVSFAAEGEERITRELAPDGAEEIDVLALERPTVYEFSAATARLKVRLTPDGVVEFLETDAPVDTMVRGTERNEVRFRLQPGQRVSIWPVATLTVRAVEGGFSVDAAAAGWAFVVRADDVGARGLSVRCDGIPCKIRSGQRIDSDRKGPKVVFRVAGGRSGYPGRIVGVTEPKEPPPRPVEVARGVTEQATPGVLVASARDFPWQSVPLPVLSWEVFRPADVSP